MAFPSPSKSQLLNDPKGKAIVEGFQFLSYAIRDESVSRQEIYMSCLETCSEAAAYIAILTRQNKQSEEHIRFLEKESSIMDDRIRRLEEPKQSASSQDDITDEEMPALPCKYV